MTESQDRIPAHVAIIMDGNGRWAMEKGMDRTAGHTEGVKSVRACVEAAAEAGVKCLSLFAFSEENWDRSQLEVSFLMEMMVRCIEAEQPSLVKNGVKVMVLGNRGRLTDALNAKIDVCEKATAGGTRLTLVIFLSYSGRWDILQAVKKIAAEAASGEKSAEKLINISAEEFSQYLVTSQLPEPDLIIRTSGEVRLSNFLLWQGAYSEMVFTDVLWPDFRKEQFLDSLAEFAKRDRRYGKVK